MFWLHESSIGAKVRQVTATAKAKSASYWSDLIFQILDVRFQISDFRQADEQVRSGQVCQVKPLRRCRLCSTASTGALTHRNMLSVKNPKCVQ